MLVRRSDLAEPAARLALLRIVVSLLFLVMPEVHQGPARAAIPATLRVVPEGLHWFVAVIPITPGVARVAQAICVFAALAAAAGLHARLALAVASVSGFYLFSLSQLSGWVWHDMHVLWMSALLAASPCDEALAFDRGATRSPADHARYGVPAQFARALLACVYFFPGVHKLARSGIAWALSDNLAYQLYWKWTEHGLTSPFRVDRVPGALQAGGLFVLAFEITFPVVLFVPRARIVYAAGGIVFHLLAWMLFRIPFASLWLLYVVLLPNEWIRAIERRFARLDAASAVANDSRAAWWVGSLLVIAAAVQGARGQMRAYPFACYPTFEWRAGREMPDLAIELERADGSRVELPRGHRTQRQWGEIWSLAGVNDPVDARRLRAYVGPRRNAVRVRVYRVYLDVRPEERGRERGRLEIAEWAQ
jgi:hypothetical protein